MISIMKVELYTQPECPPCTIVKQFLHHHGVSYEEYDVKKDNVARNRMVNEYDSFSTPTVVVDGTAVAGFNIEKLQQLLDITE
jgi:glutaredoxin 3